METTLAGRYHIVKHLGGGGFGQTFLAKDSHLPSSPLCVVKKLQPKVASPESLDIAKRLFQREAETLYRLGHHDRIPRLLAHFEQLDEFYLVQDYVEGTPLDQEMVVGQRSSEAVVLELLYDVLDVLSFVHHQHVIHRDIKPANLIRRSVDGKIVLIDFGAVKEVNSQAASLSGNTSMTVAIGSPGYMPMEQQAFKPHFSSDIYAAGMVCIQALSGLLPRQLPRNATTNELNCALLNLDPPIDPGLAAILDKMVRYDYRQRYKNGTEALQALQQFLGLVPQVAPDETVLSPRRSPDAKADHLAVTQPPSWKTSSEPGTRVRILSEGTKKSLEQLLAGTIGPIATVMLARVLAESTTDQDLVERMILHLPVEQQKRIREQMLAILKQQVGDFATLAENQRASPATVPPPPPPPPSPALDPSFVKRCEQELAKTIGPIAHLLIQRTLSQYPHLSQMQLIENLSQHLPNAAARESFRQLLS